MEFVEGTARSTELQSLEDVLIVLMLPLSDLPCRGSLRAVQIHVRMDGSGMDEKKAQDIDEPFHRVSGLSVSSSK